MRRSRSASGRHRPPRVELLKGFADGDGRRFLSLVEQVPTAAAGAGLTTATSDFAKSSTSPSLRRFDKRGDEQLALNAAEACRPTFNSRRPGRELLGYAEQFDLVVAWLEKHPQARTLNANRLATSYNWKHVAEKAIKRYIPNGVFVTAALHVGLVVESIEGTYDAHVNLSQELLNIQRLLQRSRAVV